MPIPPRPTWMFFRPAMVQIGTVLDYYKSAMYIFLIKPAVTLLSSSKNVVYRSLQWFDLLHSTVICRNLPLPLRMLGSDTYENVHIGNENTQFAISCFFPAAKEKAVTLVVSPPFSCWPQDLLFLWQFLLLASRGTINTVSLTRKVNDWIKAITFFSKKEASRQMVQRLHKY